MNRPQISYRSRETHQWTTITFPTYRELKKELKNHFKNVYAYSDEDDYIHVTRFRRGEWGEWFELWDISGGKLQLIKQGWM